MRSTSTATAADRVAVGRTSPLALYGLALAWVLFTVGEGLYGELDSLDDLGQIASAGGRFQTAALLELAAALLLIAGIVEMARHIRPDAPRLAGIGRWLALAGTVGLGAFVEVHLLVSDMTSPDLDREAISEFLTGPMAEGGIWSVPIVLVLIALPLGLLLLAIGLTKSDLIPSWPVWLIGLHIIVHLGIDGPLVEVGSHALLAIALIAISGYLLAHGRKATDRP